MSNFISVENLYYAKQIQDDINGVAYSTPKPLGSSVKINIDPTTASATFYGDGIAQEQAYQVTEAKVSIETETLPIETIADILGHSLDGNGGIVFNKNDVAPYVALMYRRKKVNGNYRYIKIFKVKFSDQKDDGQSVSNSLKIQDDALDGTAMPLINNGNWKAAADEDAVNYKDISKAWFQSVLGNAVPLTVSSITPIKGATAVADSGAINIVFSTNLNASTVNANNFTLVSDVDGSVAVAAVSYNDAMKTVTITPSAALVTATKYTVIVDTDVQDTAGNKLSSEYTSYFTTA